MKRIFFAALVVVPCLALGLALPARAPAPPPMVITYSALPDAAALDAIVRARAPRRHVSGALAPHRPGEVAVVTARAGDPASAALAEAARAIEDLWRLGRGEEAQDLLAATPGALDFRGGAGLLRLSACYRDDGRSGRVAVTVARAAGEGPLAVAFPPGTYGSAPDVQDLAFLRAAVLVLAPGEREARVEFPVACASFRKEGPLAGHPYALARFDPDSDVGRLMAELCAGDPAPEAEAQLAIWITRNGLTLAELTSKGRPMTFESHVPVRREHGAGAARIMRRAGLEPAGARFFAGRAEDAAGFDGADM
jgi:hypothetical protein